MLGSQVEASRLQCSVRDGIINDQSLRLQDWEGGSLKRCEYLWFRWDVLKKVLPERGRAKVETLAESVLEKPT